MRAGKVHLPPVKPQGLTCPRSCVEQEDDERPHVLAGRGDQALRLLRLQPPWLAFIILRARDDGRLAPLSQRGVAQHRHRRREELPVARLRRRVGIELGRPLLDLLKANPSQQRFAKVLQHRLHETRRSPGPLPAAVLQISGAGFGERDRRRTAVYRLFEQLSLPPGARLFGLLSLCERNASAFSYADSADGAAELQVRGV